MNMRRQFMRRIGLLVCAIAGVVALAQFETLAQGTTQTPAQTEANQTNCDQCRQMSANCQNEKTPTDRAFCQRMAMQCRCSK
jgi:uncharacterized membrane protein